MRRAPRLHWVSILLGLLVLMCVVSFHAYTALKPEPVPSARTTHELPDRTLALAFHGGPDPKWTPHLLDALREADVKATFFVLGMQVTRNPEVARRIVADGHRVGIDGFRTEGDWTDPLDLAFAQAALADVLGVHTRLVGAPAEVDSGDRDHQDIGTLVRMSLAQGRGVVRLHDDGSIGADVAASSRARPATGSCGSARVTAWSRPGRPNASPARSPRGRSATAASCSRCWARRSPSRPCSASCAR
ncbi:polysaccharide deacetylase family protein [Lentzea guizhouensis]|uniref:polysaccharide deacetylase family protein n=1 Tax=Lentzea guizhouensis TaxID=1586287 RepID=UPI001C54E596|nr:polysaccharide deacetylase family protein [Lentzea guizhouensis]